MDALEFLSLAKHGPSEHKAVWGCVACPTKIMRRDIIIIFRRRTVVISLEEESVLGKLHSRWNIITRQQVRRYQLHASKENLTTLYYIK